MKKLNLYVDLSTQRAVDPDSIRECPKCKKALEVNKGNQTCECGARLWLTYEDFGEERCVYFEEAE